MPTARNRVMNWFCRRPAAIFVANMPGSPRGLRFECDLRNSLAREVFFTGSYEPQETALIRRMLKPRATFVDIGAHWGYFSLIAADCVGQDGRVVAVEADPRIFGTLERTMALNGLPNVSTLQAAVAAGPGVLTFNGYDEAQDNWGLSHVAAQTGSSTTGATFEVRAWALDTLLDNQGVAAVDLVKIDIEGAEALAVEGMRAGLQSHRYRAIILELHPAHLRALGATEQVVVRQLLAAGYQGWIIDHSKAANRRAAYDPRQPPETFLRPLAQGVPFDEWPHMLWLAPGEELPRDRVKGTDHSRASG